MTPDERRNAAARLTAEGLSQREIAARFGVSRATIRKDLAKVGTPLGTPEHSSSGATVGTPLGTPAGDGPGTPLGIPSAADQGEELKRRLALANEALRRIKAHAQLKGAITAGEIVDVLRLLKRRARV